jgi:hypothetical protein
MMDKQVQVLVLDRLGNDIDGTISEQQNIR